MRCPYCGREIRENKGWAAMWYDGYCSFCDRPVEEGVEEQVWNDYMEDMIDEANNYIRKKERKIIEKWLEEIGCYEMVGHSRKAWNREITLVSKHPGMLIGKSGKNIEILKEMLREEFGGNYSVKFVEVWGDFITPSMEKTAE